MAKHVLVNKQSAAAGSSTVLVTPASPAALTDGQLAIFNAETNTAIAEGTTPGLVSFYVAQGAPSGRNPRISPIIKAGAIKKIEFKPYAAPIQPVYFVGYKQGSGGTIGFVSASGTSTVSYGIKIENLVTLAPPFPKAYSQYTLMASVGTANNNPVFVADQLAKDLNSQLMVMPSIDGGQFAVVETITDAISAATANAAVTNGSANIAFASTPAATVVAGSWLRIGAGTVATPGASGAEFPVYQIASISGNNAVLTKPYMGATSAAIVTGSIIVGTGGVTTSSLAGLRISVVGSYFTSNAYAAGKLNNMINIPLMDMLAGTPIQLGTAMVYGSGTVSEVLKKEMQSLGDLGVENRIWMPLPNDTYAASNIGTGATFDPANPLTSPGNGYSLFTLYYENSVSDKSAQGMGREETGMLDICINNYQSGTTVQNMDTLVALMGSLSGVTPGTPVSPTNAWPTRVFPGL
jgi:hypothetical protein